MEVLDPVLDDAEALGRRLRFDRPRPGARRVRKALVSPDDVLRIIREPTTHLSSPEERAEAGDAEALARLRLADLPLLRDAALLALLAEGLRSLQVANAEAGDFDKRGVALTLRRPDPPRAPTGERLLLCAETGRALRAYRSALAEAYTEKAAGGGGPLLWDHDSGSPRRWLVASTVERICRRWAFAVLKADLGPEEFSRAFSVVELDEPLFERLRERSRQFLRFRLNEFSANRFGRDWVEGIGFVTFRWLVNSSKDPSAALLVSLLFGSVEEALAVYEDAGGWWEFDRERGLRTFYPAEEWLRMFAAWRRLNLRDPAAP